VDEIHRKLRKKRIGYLNKLETASQDLDKFIQFKKRWNERLLEIERKRSSIAWEKSIEEEKTTNPALDSFSVDHDSSDGHPIRLSTCSSGANNRFCQSNLGLRASLHQRASVNDNVVFTLAGGYLFYGPLPDELEKRELRRKHQKKENRSHDESDGNEDCEQAGQGTPWEPQSCFSRFLYEWRKWAWKMKNNTLLRHCCSDHDRNSDDVARQLVDFIQQETSSIIQLRAKVKKLSAVIQETQAHPELHLGKTATAFVTFDSMALPRMTIQPFAAPHTMMVAPAPEPNDVSWKTLDVPYWRLLLTRAFVISLLTAMAIGWAFPAFIFSSLSNLQSLSNVSGFKWIDSTIVDNVSSYTISIIEGIAPAACLVLWLVTAKHIIRFILLHSYEYSKATVEWKTMSTYWAYLMICVLFVSTFGGTLSSILSDFINNPRNLISLLASAFPQNATFFINYILVLTFCVMPLTLFRFRQIFQQLGWYILMRPSTLREKAKMWRHPTFDYAGSAAQGLLVFCLTLVFSLMAPLITVFGLCYFVITYLVDRYQIIYTTRVAWQGGATMWPITFHMLMTSLLLFQLAMIGILSLTKFGGGAALVALPLITAFIWILLHFQWVTVSDRGPMNGNVVCSISSSINLLSLTYLSLRHMHPQASTK